MLINRPPDIPSSEITDESLFWNRRNFLKGRRPGSCRGWRAAPFLGRGLFGPDEDKLTPWEDVPGYNNYYESGTDKDDPSRHATWFRSRAGRL